MNTMLAFVSMAMAVLLCAAEARYTLTDDYSGVGFLQMFDYFDQPDPTNGHVRYLNRASALTDSLVGVIPAQNDTVYIGVDHASPSPEGRKSIRLASHKTYNHGLFVADFAHSPGGICGVWPAYWLLGQGQWPAGGEIDVFEGVNDQSLNAMALHTSPGCRVQGTSFSGELVTSDCDVDAPDQDRNAGCAIRHQDPRSYGSAFNAGGGGVYATEWNSTAISIWFFARDDFPAELASASSSAAPSAALDPAAWGQPAAQFGGDCDIDVHFRDMNIILDTTFCGDWAGNVWDQSETCSQKAPTCQDYVANNPADFAEAYWAVNYIRVYENGE